MRYFLLITVSITLLTACRKNDGPGTGPGPGPGYTPVPPASPVSTNLMVYALNNNQGTNPLFVHAGSTTFNYTATGDGFNTGSFTADKYNTKITAETQLTVNNPGYATSRSFTTLPALKNYADFKPINTEHAGTVTYDYGTGTFPLPAGGQITLPPYSYGIHPGSVAFSTSSFYLHPALPDYAVSLPCYPMTDENQKRWYLESYGIYFFQAYASDNAGYTINYSPAADIRIKMPIPASQLASAPDSIPAWNSDNNLAWKRNGYALKVGSFYEKRIDRKGYWNFAVPVDGVYLTVTLNNSFDVAIPNTRFRVSSGNLEIADARTNVDGKALVFVPKGKSLNLQVINDHFNWSNIAVPAHTLGTFNSAAEKTITLAGRIDVATLSGQVFNCDGTTFGNGTAVLSNNGAKDTYIIPIVNGKFKTSTWINYGYNMTDLSIRDNSGTVLSTYKTLLGSSHTAQYAPLINDYLVNFYTCSNAAKLFLNYKLDGVPLSINADASSSSMTGTDSEVNIMQNGTGVAFNGWFSTVGGNYFTSGLKVNGATCQFDDSKGWSEVFITRRDAAIGGFIEGWFSINYKDASNVSRNITGNFRVKKAG